jgi:hypothetical protein
MTFFLVTQYSDQASVERYATVRNEIRLPQKASIVARSSQSFHNVWLSVLLNTSAKSTICKLILPAVLDH